MGIDPLYPLTSMPLRYRGTSWGRWVKVAGFADNLPQHFMLILLVNMIPNAPKKDHQVLQETSRYPLSELK